MKTISTKGLNLKIETQKAIEKNNRSIRRGRFAKALTIAVMVYGAGCYLADKHYNGPYRSENAQLDDSLKTIDRQLYAREFSLGKAKDELVSGLKDEYRDFIIAKASIEGKIKANEALIDKDPLKKARSWYYLFE